MREVAETEDRAGASRSVRALLGGILVVLGLLLLGVSSASALSQRGHEYRGEAIGEPGTGSGQLKAPTAVAVNETTGAIYVVDSGNNRIEEFDAAHHFVSAWGWGVADGQEKYEVCTESCRAGLPGHKAGQLRYAASIAVDNSSGEDPSAGDVYAEVVTPYTEGTKSFEFGIVDKFSASGQLLAEIKAFKGEKFEEPNGIAVGAQGTLWIYDEETFYGFSNAVEPKATISAASEALGGGKPGLAFDAKASANGGFLVAHGFSGGDEEIAVTAKEVLLEEENESKEETITGVPVSEALDAFNTTGLASDSSSGDAYVDHGTEVAAFDHEAEPIQTFGHGTITAGAGLAADAADDDVLVADSGAGRVEVFQPEEPGAATVDELSASETTATSSTLGSLIDPHGTATRYAFRYSTGAVPRAGEACSGSCVETTAGSLPAVFGHQAVTAELSKLAPSTVYHYRVFAEYELGGKTLFSEAGTEEGGELTFKTQQEVLGETLPDGRQWQLVSPDAKNGASILDMPVEGGLSQASKDGSRVTYVAEGAFGAGSEPEGNRAPEVTQVLSERTKEGWSTTDIDTKHNEAEGVTPGSAPEYRAFSEDLSTGLVVPFGKSAFEAPPLSTEASERTPYLRHDETCAQVPTSCYQPLVKAGNVPAETVFGGRVTFLAGTATMSHVVLSSTAHLTSEPAFASNNLYDWSAGQLQLISRLPSGEPAPYPALGGSAFASTEVLNLRNAISGNGSRFVFSTYYNAVQRVSTNEPSGLYLRSMAQPDSIRLDVPEAGTSQAPGSCSESSTCEHPVFQGASEDGSTIFFTDQERLTKEAGANYRQPDLYACEVKEENNEIVGCNLTDLSVARPGESGNVQGNVLGVGKEGSVVYFVADGALAGGATGNCRAGEVGQNKELHESTEAQPISTTCGMFVEHRLPSGGWSGPELVQRLSGEDEYDWGTQPGRLATVVARVSPNGQWLAFMSDESLTPPYNTRDRNSGRPAEEVYLYNETTKATICASCNPTGARPDAILDQEDSGEGIGLLADRSLLWTKRRLAANIPSYVKISENEAFYQPQFLGDEGRLFFNSPEALVPQDTNGKEDVYQYEPTGIASGNCQEAGETFVARAKGCVSLISSGTADKESAFLEANANGDDVFFLTPASLVAADTNTSYDVYDASICGAEIAERPECLSAPKGSEKECESAAECGEGSGSSQTFGSSASEGASSGGDISPQHEVLSSTTTVAPKAKTLTRAQKLAKALKACHKVKKHKPRAQCERAARKKYGPVGKKAAGTSHSSRRGR